MGKKPPGGPGLLHAPLGPHGRALVPAAHAASVVSWPLPRSSFLFRKGVTLTFKQPVASDPSSGISESTAEVCCERRRGPTLPAHVLASHVLCVSTARGGVRCNTGQAPAAGPRGGGAGPCPGASDGRADAAGPGPDCEERCSEFPLLTCSFLPASSPRPSLPPWVITLIFSLSLSLFFIIYYYLCP